MVPVMADSHSYEPVLSSKAAAFLVSLSKARQRKLIALLYQLADNPSQKGTTPSRIKPHVRFSS